MPNLKFRRIPPAAGPAAEFGRGSSASQAGVDGRRNGPLGGTRSRPLQRCFWQDGAAVNRAAHIRFYRNGNQTQRTLLLSCVTFCSRSKRSLLCFLIVKIEIIFQYSIFDSVIMIYYDIMRNRKNIFAFCFIG